MTEAIKEAAASDASAVARWILDNFDLAPKGTLQPFKDQIAKMAREKKA